MGERPRTDGPRDERGVRDGGTKSKRYGRNKFSLYY